MTSLVKLSRCSQRSLSTTCSLYRLKAEWRMDRKPANTKLSDETIVEERKAFGGYKKLKAISVSHGKYSLISQGIEHAPLKILDVIHTNAGDYLIKENIIVKGTLLLVDINPVKDNIEVEKLTNCEELLEHVKTLYDNGQFYARVTSKPGQVGNCDGVLIEGDELKEWIQKLHIPADSVETDS